MRISRHNKILRFSSHRLLLLMIVVVMAVRLVPHCGEWYARNVYPGLSAAVSWVASAVPFSLTEWIVIGAIGWIIVVVIRYFRQRSTIRQMIFAEIRTVLWMIVWFYVGWGMNYNRDSFYSRAGIETADVDTAEFKSFLTEYTDSLNASYCNIHHVETDGVMAEVKRLYASVPEAYGLAKPKSWQRPKNVSFNWLYSSVGVLGYMGPFADESHLNAKLLPAQYAFTYAHELAHLLSVSSEAEANLWAYVICTHSNDRQTRYAGYYGILPNVFRNARDILTDSEFAEWRKTIDKRILAQRMAQQEFWAHQYSPLLADIQDAMFNALLRSNHIPDGMKNYDQVVRMIMSVKQGGKTLLAD